jgi:hypothetical protein
VPDLTPIPQALDTPERVRAIWQELYGVSGSNGLKRKVRDHEMRLKRLEIGQARLVVIAGFVSGTIVSAITYALKAIGA